jgi:hypothetical protein
MAEFIVVTWATVQNRLQQHDEAVDTILSYWRDNAKRFRLNSLRYFSQGIGGNPFGYGHVMIYEFESLADWETFESEMAEDKEALALKEQLFANIDLATRRVVEWHDELRSSWVE